MLRFYMSPISGIRTFARRRQYVLTPPIPIEKLLFDGQSITVQVIKDPIGTKGARLSTQISIAGRMLVYLPQDSHIGISQRIEKEAEREAAARQSAKSVAAA